jgi:glycosyltransferase involved in cell wall biosynthesis
MDKTPQNTLALCVTNDLLYDQRIQRMDEVLSQMGFQVVQIGRRRKLSGALPKGSGDVRLRCWFNSGPLFYLEFNLRLFLFLLIKAPNVIVANDADTLAACALAAKFRGRQLVYDSHEWFTEVPELKGQPIKRRIWHYLQKIFVPAAQLCVTVGPKLAVRLSNLYEREFSSIRNLPYQKEGFSSGEENILIYQGTLNVGRGLEEAIEAMGELKDWKLWVVGDGPILSKLQEMTQEMGLSERVVFYGSVAPEVLHDLTRKARIGLNMLHATSKNYYFSLANKFFDYVQAGIPVITMNFPEYRALNDAHRVAVLLDDCRADALVAAVKEVDQNYDKLSKKCRAMAEVWTWEKESEKVIDLYRPFIQT